MSLIITAVTEALFHVKFVPALQVTHFIEEPFCLHLQLPSRPCTFSKHFSAHDTAHLLKYWQFILKDCMSILAKKLYLLLPGQITALVQIS
jgi:hypothetical protein